MIHELPFTVAGMILIAAMNLAIYWTLRVSRLPRSPQRDMLLTAALGSAILSGMYLFWLLGSVLP